MFLRNEGVKAIHFERPDLAPPDLRRRLNAAKTIFLNKNVADMYGIKPSEVDDLPFVTVADLFGYQDLLQALEELKRG